MQQRNSILPQHRPLLLNHRDRTILTAVVEAYIQNGEPVASRTIARQSSGLSPATIRNVMADLSDEGFLSQPHTSAGRIPTDQAFRFYVKALSPKSPNSGEVSRLRARIKDGTSVGDRVAIASHSLAEMTRRLGIAAAIPTTSQILEHIELVALSDRRVLMILATSDRMVRNRITVLEQQHSQEDLAEIRNFINRTYQGWQLGAVRRDLENRLAQESAAFDLMSQRLQVLYENGLLDIDADTELHLEGAANLLNEELLQAEERVRELLHALEQKKAVLQLLDRFLEDSPGELSVQVGLGEVHESMDGMSMVGTQIVLPGGMRAKVAVVGPMRMDYTQAVAAVLNMGKALQAENS
jgi:heat-inducible transcriptional repressor